ATVFAPLPQWINRAGTFDAPRYHTRRAAIAG
ncbi:hypothetical protein FBY34_8192, partial [Streptomyces sp. SLBN-115]